MVDKFKKTQSDVKGEAKEATPKPGGRPVLVTTEHRGVFFGYAEETAGDNITLKQARNCIYWSRDVKGFLGLAVTGPTDGCRVGPAAPSLDLRKVTSVTEVSPAAVEAWEKAPWES